MVARLFAMLALAWIPALAGGGAIRSAAALYPLAESAHPYFVPSHAGLLYLGAPLVALSACLLFLSPGLFLSIALGGAETAGVWVVSALGLSIVVNSAAAAVVQAIMGSPLRGAPFAAVIVACAAVCAGFLALRGRRCTFVWPRADATLVSMLPASLILLVALAPKFYWESFNGDGAHTYESARLLLVRPVPFWPSAAGGISSWPGLNTMLFLYPASWFIRLFGEVEAAARLPIVLYLAALYGILVAVIGHARLKAMGLAERLLLWLALAVYTVVMAFSATYDPYSADIAQPMCDDTLQMICFLSFIFFFLRKQPVWMCYFLALTVMASAGGVLLAGLWLLATLVLWKPWPWRQLALAATALAAGFAIASLAPHVLAALHLPQPGSEHSEAGLLDRFRYRQWFDWRRLVFLVAPGGILPAAALAAWRRQDRPAQAVTAVTVIYFGLFYMQRYINLHYFVPAMLLPLIVFWRNPLVADASRRRLVAACTAMGGIVAFAISLPKTAAPITAARLVGSAVEDRLGGYDTSDAAVFRRAALLHRLFPPDWDPRVPQEAYGGSPLAWNYYAHRMPREPSGARFLRTNYILQAASLPAPEGTRRVAEEDGAALYVRSDAILAKHRALRPPAPAGSPIYVIPRRLFFRPLPGKDQPPWIDGKTILRSLGVRR